MQFQNLLVRKIIFRRFIPWAAVMAVAGGIFSLIAVLSVMEGFKVEMRDRLRGTLSHIRVLSPSARMLDLEELNQSIVETEHVVATAPFVEARGLYQATNSFLMCELRGIDPVAQAKVGDFASYLLRDDEIAELEEHYDTYELKKLNPRADEDRKPFTEDELKHLFSRQRRKEVIEAKVPLTRRSLMGRLPQPVVIGKGFLTSSGFRLGDVMTILTFSPKNQEVCSQDFLIVGFCKSGIQEHDQHVIYTSLRAAQKYLQLFDEQEDQFRYSGISVQLDDYENSPLVKEKLTQKIFDKHGGRFSFGVLTWEFERRNLLQAVQVEKTIITAMMMLVVAFAGGMIFLILSLIVIEKTKDLGVLRSIGARPASVVGLFMRLGLILVGIGITVGGTAGYFFVENINEIHDYIADKTGLTLFPPDIYYLTEIPVSLKPLDIALVLGSAVLFGFLGSLIPAIWAANRDPIRALRHE